MTDIRVALIGFGEAAQAFADGMDAVRTTYDLKLDAAETRSAKLAEVAALGVMTAGNNAEAVRGAAAILSLVTADQAVAAARETARSVAPGALYLDMNSVSPGAKREAATAIEGAGGRYVDVAVMAPVHPLRRAVPLLAAGAHAGEAAALLRRLGFTDVRAVGAEVGQASAIKMIRSVMVKGMEALSAECALAAHRAGVLAEVAASLDASERALPWAERFDYNLDRMMVHGGRRAAEMEEVVRTLDDLGVVGVMSRGAVVRQRALGALDLKPPLGLAAKLAALDVKDRTE